MKNLANTGVFVIPVDIEWSSKRGQLGLSIKDICHGIESEFSALAESNVHVLGFLYSFSGSDRKLVERYLDPEDRSTGRGRVNFVSSPNALRALISHELNIVGENAEEATKAWRVEALAFTLEVKRLLLQPRRVLKKYSGVSCYLYSAENCSWRACYLESQPIPGLATQPASDEYAHSQFISAITARCRDTKGARVLRNLA